MRIIKYIFLLIVLGLLALFVFIATKDGKYELSESRMISLKKSTLFDYVNDYKNWEDFFVIKNDSSAVQYNYSKITTGIGSSFNWKNGLDEGEIKTIYLKENDSIAQKVNWFGTNSDANITFKDTIGGTIVKWNCSGNQDFIAKLFSVFYGGIENQLQTNFQKSLNQLDVILTKELNTYSITINEIIDINKIYYIKRKSISKNLDYNLKLKKEIPLLLEFVKENEVPGFGSPFTVFEESINKNDILKYALSLPLKEKIYTTPESEFTIDSIMPHKALKIILKGDYSHRIEAWNKGLAYLKKNNLEENITEKYREVYFKNKTDIKNPSQWITDIYIPISYKKIEKPKVKVQTDSILIKEPIE